MSSNEISLNKQGESITESSLDKKEKMFRELLVEGILKDEYEFCYNRSDMSDIGWGNRRHGETRSEAFLNVVKDVNDSTTIELLERYDGQYEHLYDEVRNRVDESEMGKSLGEKRYIIRDLRTGGFSHHDNIDSLFEMLKYNHLHRGNFAEKEKLEENHRLNLLSTKERKEMLEFFEYELLEPTAELVKEWENYTDKEFYQGVKEIAYKEAIKIIDNRKDDDCIGSFFFRDADVYIAIDNTDGEAFVEEFRDFEYCLEWLTNGGVEYDPKKALGINDAIYVSELNDKTQKNIKKELENVISELGIYEKGEIQEHVQYGMDSKISDLTDTIDIYDIIADSKINKDKEKQVGKQEMER